MRKSIVNCLACETHGKFMFIPLFKFSLKYEYLQEIKQEIAYIFKKGSNQIIPSMVAIKGVTMGDAHE